MSASRWSGSPPAAPQGASSVLFYMAVYVVMTLGAFLVRAVDARRRRASRSRPSPACPACRRPGRRFAAALAIFMFSLAGIPPLFGFWPKLLVFNAAVAGGLCRARRGRHRRHR